MGIFDQNLQTTSTPSSSMTANQLPQWVSEAGQNLYNQAAQISGQDFQPFEGQRVAGFNPQQQTAMNMSGANTGSWQPQLDQASQLATQASQQWTPEGAAQYMDPFNQSVLNRQAEELNREFAQQNQQASANAVSNNAFGGSRSGIMNAEVNRNQNQALQDMYLRGGSAAYDRGLQAFSADKASQLAASGQLSQLAGQGQQQGMADISQLLQTGGMQQQQDQSSLDTAYGDYLEQREYPYRQMNFLGGVLQGTPYETRSTNTGVNTQVSAGTSPLGQISGALSGLYGAYKMGQ